MTMKKLTREGATFVIEYDSLVNRTVRRIKPSGIRKFFDIANEMDDVISLSVGEPDFHTPWHIREAGIESLEKGRTSYTPNRGFLKLRAEISNFIERHYHVKYDPQDEVLVTVGGSEAIDLCVRTLVEPGDEVLIPEPSFVCYVPITEMAGGVPVIIETKPENGFRLTAQELEEKITDKTKLLILPYPNNPTGAVMRRADLEAVARVVERHNLLVLSDEIYAALTYGSEPHTAFSAIPGMQERTILVNGFSKSHSMTGWRMGYLAAPKAIFDAAYKLYQHSLSCMSGFLQKGAVEAFHCEYETEQMRQTYAYRRDLFTGALNRIPGVRCLKPEGAFYAWVFFDIGGMDSTQMCEYLLENAGVVGMPGSAYGEETACCMRFSFANATEDLERAAQKITDALAKLQQ